MKPDAGSAELKASNEPCDPHSVPVSALQKNNATAPSPLQAAAPAFHPEKYEMFPIPPWSSPAAGSFGEESAHNDHAHDVKTLALSRRAGVRKYKSVVNSMLPARKDLALEAARIAADCPDAGHGTKDRFKCPVPGCQFAANRRYSIKVHARTHTNEYPYHCAEPNCNKRFKWRSSMSHHQRSQHKKCSRASTDPDYAGPSGSSQAENISRPYPLLSGASSEPNLDEVSADFPTSPISSTQNPARASKSPFVLVLEDPAVMMPSLGEAGCQDSDEPSQSLRDVGYAMEEAPCFEGSYSRYGSCEGRDMETGENAHDANDIGLRDLDIGIGSAATPLNQQQYGGLIKTEEHLTRHFDA